jgi:hypothetical protein
VDRLRYFSAESDSLAPVGGTFDHRIVSRHPQVAVIQTNALGPAAIVWWPIDDLFAL